MTNLELTLAAILSAIGEAAAGGNAQTLDALLRRKEAICAALAAPEQAWDDAHEQASDALAHRKAA